MQNKQKSMGLQLMFIPINSQKADLVKPWAHSSQHRTQWQLQSHKQDRVIYNKRRYYLVYPSENLNKSNLSQCRNGSSTQKTLGLFLSSCTSWPTVQLPYLSDVCDGVTRASDVCDGVTRTIMNTCG